MSASPFTTVGRAILTVENQQRAADFYVGTLGFEVRVDGETPAGRWIEVALPGAQTSIALLPAQDDEARISLNTTDADAARAALVSAGVAAGEVMRWGNGVPPMFAFPDSEGNTVRVVEA